IFQYYITPPPLRIRFLPDERYRLLLFISLTQISAYLVGFISQSSRRRAVPHPQTITLQANDPCAPILIPIGCVLAVIGCSAKFYFISRSGGFTNFYSSPHGSAGAYAEVGAYISLLTNLMFVALAFLLPL